MKKLFWAVPFVFGMFFILSGNVNADQLNCDAYNADQPSCELEIDCYWTNDYLPSGPCIYFVCGDGYVMNTEGCDDGDIDNGDGCSDICQVESGYTCDLSEPSVCTLIPTPPSGMVTLSSGEVSTLLGSLGVAMGGILDFILDGSTLWLILAAGLMILYFLKRFLSVKGAYATATQLKTPERPKYLKSRL